jgi:hypothetical protein
MNSFTALDARPKFENVCHENPARPEG